MGQRQLPINSESNVTGFAERLRNTRQSANLTLRKLAAVSGYAASTLSTAENGKKLPSWEVVSAYVKACGETDLTSWRRWWDIASVQQTTQAAHTEPIAGGDLDFVAPTTIRTRRWVITVTALSSAAVTAVGFLMFSRAAASSPSIAASALVTPGSTSNAKSQKVTDGTDPQLAGCGTDSTTLDRAPVILHQAAILHGRKLTVGTQVGTVVLRYSAHCGGAWPRFEPTPGLNPDSTETGVGAVTVEGERPIDDTATVWKMGHIDRAYADLLLTGLGCVTAIARVDMVGQNAVATGQTHCLPRT